MKHTLTLEEHRIKRREQVKLCARAWRARHPEANAAACKKYHAKKRKEKEQERFQ